MLARVGGNRARAASMLAIRERNLYRLIKRYGAEEHGVPPPKLPGS